MSREVVTDVVADVIGSNGSVDPAKVQDFMKHPTLQFTFDCLVVLHCRRSHRSREGQVRGLRGGGRRGWCEEWARIS
jgi:hypothetical protein